MGNLSLKWMIGFFYVIIFSFFVNTSWTSSQNFMTYKAGEFELLAGQSLTVASTSLTLNKDCTLSLFDNQGKLVWLSGSTIANSSSCTDPTFTFTKSGALVVTGTVNGISGSLFWSSGVSGSATLVFSDRFPYLRLLNLDGSTAWGLNSTLALLSPLMVGTQGITNPLYANLVSTSRPQDTASNPGDIVDQFLAPNNQVVKITVHAPIIKKTVHAPPITNDQDPLAYFNGVIQSAGPNSHIIFPTATYTFSSADCQTNNYNASWEISTPTDLILDGNGSTLLFSGMCHGVTLTNSTRVIFKNFKIDWPTFQLAELGTVTSTSVDAGGTYHYVLQVDQKYLATMTKPVLEALVLWDDASQHIKIFPQRGVFYGTKGPTIPSNGIVEAASYSTQMQLNDRVLLVNYSAEGVHCVNAQHGQDVTFENLDLHSCPSGAIQMSLVTGYRIANSTITRRTGELVSMTGDGFHMYRNGGDIIIENNTIAYNTDDGINLNSGLEPLTFVSSSSSTTSTITFPSSNPITSMLGDTIGLFRPDMQSDQFAPFKVSNDQNSMSKELLTLSNYIEPQTHQGYFVADLSTSSARYIMRNNTIQFNAGHGVLAQTAYGLIENNSLVGQVYAAIDLDAQANGNMEGLGVQNVQIFSNKIDQNGGNYGSIVILYHNSNGIVFVTGPQPLSPPQQLPPVPSIHQNLIFSGNSISDSVAGGFYISSANNVILKNNTLNDTNTQNVTGTLYNVNYPFVVNDSSCVLLSGNSSNWTAGSNPLEYDTNSSIWIKAENAK